jgi:selenocysteine lyase/cysteine desulfurase
MGIIGLGAAIELLFEVGINAIEVRVQGLGDLIIREAEARGFTVLTPKDRQSRGGIVTFSGTFDPSAIKDALREKGIMVNVRGGGIRVSPHFYNNERDINKLFAAIDEILHR